ncbi:protein-disulfide reductase DsbD family protein [Thalassobellus citreus]|uniref:protein-disulfide reductase DsbD family protein n=1 Tax=Thalassobellus citreus TaxID=3367752 RepID=UPI00379A569A
MKRILLIALFTISFFGNAQILEPVKWSTSVEKLSDTEYQLEAKANIEKGWHLYSQTVPDGGPIPTAFMFDDANGSIKLKGNTSEEEGHTVDDPVFEMKIKFFEKTASFKQKVEVQEGVNTINGFVEFMSCNDTQCSPPTEVELVFKLSDKPADSAIEENSKIATAKIDDTKGKDSESKKGLWAIFLGTLFAGLFVLFTPCVFPMIPMTMSFFLKQNKDGTKGKFNAIFYGLCIVSIYVLISLPFHLFESLSPNIFNSISTNVYLNIAFFIIFIVFAFSFFGAYEIVLPTRFASKADSASNSGGLLGIFFMALTLIIVSFSCTGPALGLILGSVLSSDGGATALSVAMLGFGLGLAFPFMLFALFPSWLSSLPKSGGWLNTVKVVFGFVELALAFKFLSNADLVLQLHWLEREVFIAIWIAIFGTLALYLFGKIQLPHDSPLNHISVGRMSLAMISLIFTLYMLPGLWGAPLNLISAFPPPQHYSESPYGVGFTKIGSGTASTHDALPDGAHLMAPHDILAFNDYDKGLAYAKKVGKPVMIDFTGHACVNCRKMENNVWTKPNILNILKNDVILISLYVDDKRKLEEKDQITSKISGKKLKYIGQKWSELQTIKYKANTQPMYVLMDHNEENLIDPVAYTPDVEAYHTWLKAGVSNFK